MRVWIRGGRPSSVGYIAAADPAAARAAVEAARRDLAHLQAFALRPIGELETRLVHEEDWAEAWKEHFPVLRVGRRLVIRPTWREHARAGDEVVIILDPGMAFGTGLHPTTRLCLAFDRGPRGPRSDRRRERPRRWLRLGHPGDRCRSAGRRSVLGVDTDPLAVETTLSERGAQRARGVIAARARQRPTGDGGRSSTFVLANLIASLLVDLADRCGRRPCGPAAADRERHLRRP